MQFVNELLRFLQSGIAAIFDFVRTIWSWSINEVSAFINLPWPNLPLWKLALSVIFGAVASFLFYRAGREMWGAIEKVLRAFAALLGTFVTVLPQVLGGGIVIAILMWILRTF